MLRTCRLCGAPFEAQNNAQGYCSHECSREAARIRDREYRRRKKQASRPASRTGPPSNAAKWERALEVMRETGKSYGQCQAEGLFGPGGRRDAHRRGSDAGKDGPRRKKAEAEGLSAPRKSKEG